MVAQPADNMRGPSASLTTSLGSGRGTPCDGERAARGVRRALPPCAPDSSWCLGAPCTRNKASGSRCLHDGPQPPAGASPPRLPAKPVSSMEAQQLVGLLCSAHKENALCVCVTISCSLTMNHSHHKAVHRYGAMVQGGHLSQAKRKSQICCH